MKFSAEQIELIKKKILREGDDDDLALFVQQCIRTGLDPFSRQIYASFRTAKNPATNQFYRIMTVEATIDGLRLIAQRTGEYRGQTATYWCGEDGKWVDVWLSNSYPAAAKVGVYREGFKEPLYAIAKWSSYCQKTKTGQVSNIWSKMPDLMLAKCAESLALRKAFPNEMSGIYGEGELPEDKESIPDSKQEPIIASSTTSDGREKRSSLLGSIGDLLSEHYPDTEDRNKILEKVFKTSDRKKISELSVDQLKAGHDQLVTEIMEIKMDGF